MEYFTNFPRINYANTVALDISRRVNILRSVQSNPYAFQPYDQKGGERPDRIADLYYGDGSREWLVYLSNQTIDPYMEVYQTDEDFEQFIITKYGSSDRAKRLTKHYSFAWWVTDVPTSVATFSTIAENLKKFYEPIFDSGESTRILSYRLRREDWISTTNVVLTLNVDKSFANNEYVTFSSGNTVTGHAEICWANSSAIRVQHVENVGNTGPGYGPGNTVTGYDSGIAANITAQFYTCNTLTDDIRPYYLPVSFYDFEKDKNEGRKLVKLVDRRFVPQIEQELSNLLK